MVFSYTGLAYSFLFFASSFLAYHFFQYWQRMKDTVSKLFFLFIVPLVLFTFISAITGFFFAGNISLLSLMLKCGGVLQGIAFGILLYAIIYLKFPRISPWIGFFLIFSLGILATIFSPTFDPLLESSGSISWNLPFSLSYTVLRILIVFPLIGFIPILNEQYKSSKEPMIRARALGMTLFFLVGIGAGVLDFLAGNPFIRDIGYMVLSVFVIILIIITQKPSLPEEKYTFPHSSKI